MKYFFRVLALCVCGFFAYQSSFAQNSNFYTVIHAGGIFGLSSQSQLGTINGYKFEFVFGKSFQDKAYLGMGLGNSTFKGKMPSPTDPSKIVERNIQMLPIYADFRLPISEMGMLGRLNSFMNAGFAPPLSNQYMQGWLGQVGLSYEHLLADRSHLNFSLGYGIQQFATRGYRTKYNQNQITLTVGLIVF